MDFVDVFEDEHGRPYLSFEGNGSAVHCRSTRRAEEPSGAHKPPSATAFGRWACRFVKEKEKAEVPEDLTRGTAGLFQQLLNFTGALVARALIFV